MANIVVKSSAFSFIPEDIKSILTGASIAAIGAFITVIADNVAKLNFGQYTPFVAAAIMVVINAIRKFISKSKYAV